MDKNSNWIWKQEGSWVKEEAIAKWKWIIIRSGSRQYSLLQSAINKKNLLHVRKTIPHLWCNGIIGFVGGLRVALRGTGLEGVNLVLFGSQPCPILEDTRNSTRIECKIPSRVRNHIFLAPVSCMGRAYRPFYVVLAWATLVEGQMVVYRPSLGYGIV